MAKWATSTARKNPLPGPLARPASVENTRKSLLTHFPYLVIYAPLPDGLLVLAAGHQHRRPNYWRERQAEQISPRGLRDSRSPRSATKGSD